MIEQPIGRAPALDLGRFLAALAVYFYHTMYLEPLAGRSPWTSSLDWLACYGYLGVEYFFMLSGFVICWSAEGNTRLVFAQNRIARLLPAFAICASLSSAMLAYQEEPVSVARFLANLTFQAKALGYPFIDQVYWSLAAETLFYAAVFLFAIGPNLRRNLRIAIIIWGILAILPIGGSLRVLLNINWASYFGVGIALFLWRTESRSIDRILFYAFVALSTFEMYARSQEVGIELALQPNPFAAAAIVLALGLSLPWLTRVTMSERYQGFALLAGALSYPLYLLHNEFYRPVIIVAWSVGIWAAILANLALLVICYAVHRAEVPLRKWLRWIGRERPSPPLVITGRVAAIPRGKHER